MADVFRIIDRFTITGRGSVYTLKDAWGDNFHVGEMFYDLHGHRFCVKGIEMASRPLTGLRLEDLPLGIIMELIDGIDAEGNFLVRNPDALSFIFCSHPLYPDRVDDDYKSEYQAAGLKHPCALFSYENMEQGRLSLCGEAISGLAIYRGWMMKPELYRSFYRKLTEKGIILINTPEEYEKYHLLPGWYDDFKDCTPSSVWEDKGTLDSALELTKELEGSCIVKDYVKSRKHEWYEACFIRDISDRKSAAKVIETFIRRQGSDLVGGIVLRKFENLRTAGFHEVSGMPLSEEYRVFVFAGRVLIMDNYWRSSPNVYISEDEMKWIDSIARQIKGCFVTIDLARREDGTLIIMEIGDGQVSGLQQIAPEDFYRAFENAK